MNSDLIQSPINWKQISPTNFENLVFFLFDDMGFKNLEWRKGGEGISSTDGGRDLEAIYTNLEPGDIVTLEKWWIEVKYRSKNLSSTAVKESILNATGREGVSIFAIVTTGTISNKTLDWIKEFQKNRPALRIRTWQGHDLERILRKYPQTVSRFFPGLMSITDRLEAIKNRFWNSLTLPTMDEIDFFWREFASIEWDVSAFLPFTISEASYGYPEFRQWGQVSSKDLLLQTFLFGLSNVPYMAKRFEQYGKNSLPLVEGLSYLLQMSLSRLDLEEIIRVIANPYQVMEGDTDPQPELLDFIWKPVLSQMYFDLGANCSQNCDKVDWGYNSRHLTISYFDRFANREQLDPSSKEKPFVIIQLKDSSCTIGTVPKGEFCPLSDDIPDNCGDIAVLEKLLIFTQKVIRSRKSYIESSRNDDAG